MPAKHHERLYFDEPNRCQLCGCPTHEALFWKDCHKIVRCKGCHLVYVQLDDDVRDFADIYNEEYYLHTYADYLNSEKTFAREFTRKLKKVRKYVHGGRLLDVGCAAGYFLKIAHQFFDVVGVEISKYASEYAQAQGFTVHNCDILNADLTEDSFDVVTMWDVIEHLPNPNQVLSYVHELLRKNGFVFIVTGDISSIIARIAGKKWRVIAPPHHLFFFSEYTLVKMLTKNGFQVIDVSYDWRIVDLGLILKQLQVMIPSQMIIKISGAIERLTFSKIWLPVNLFDTMTVIAQKRQK